MAWRRPNALGIEEEDFDLEKWDWRDREQMIFQVEKARAQERGPSCGEQSLTTA